MTPLGQRLAAQIAAEGPITIANYMAACLGDPEHGYYQTRDPLGLAGDFITAPEISQIFGELIGVWCLAAFKEMGSPGTVNLVELGPGRGTLMSDLLRAARIRPDFGAALRLHLVETSPVLRRIQADKLHAQASPQWHDSIASLPDGPMIIIANEFFDALPIHQYQRTENGWRERCVGLDETGRLVIGLGAIDIDPRLLPPGAIPEGTIFESSPAQIAIMAELSGRISRNGGALLAIDYGHLTPGFGDSLQAVRDHRPDDILAHPGNADLTAHVDFSSLAATAIANHAYVAGLSNQGDFLLRLGLLERAGQLGAGKDLDTQNKLQKAVERLASPISMGELFKVIAITSGFNMPGFEK